MHQRTGHRLHVQACWEVISVSLTASLHRSPSGLGRMDNTSSPGLSPDAFTSQKAPPSGQTELVSLFYHYVHMKKQTQWLGSSPRVTWLGGKQSSEPDQAAGGPCWCSKPQSTLSIRPQPARDAGLHRRPSSLGHDKLHRCCLPPRA